MSLPVIHHTRASSEHAVRIRKTSRIVSYNAARECFVNHDTKKRYKGVTTTAKRVFYRDYVYRHVSASKKHGGGTSTCMDLSTGMERGKEVDHQISNWANEPEPPRKPHVYSEKIAAAILKLGLVPIGGQVPVYDDDLMIATAADLVCYSKKNNCLVLCEIKCGWNGSGAYKKASGRMHSAMSAFDNSPANQHQIQLGMTHYLFGVTFGTTSHESYVVRCADRGVYFYKLEDSVMSRIGKVCTAMSESKSVRRNSKKKRINSMAATHGSARKKHKKTKQ